MLFLEYLNTCTSLHPHLILYNGVQGISAFLGCSKLISPYTRSTASQWQQTGTQPLSANNVGKENS